MKYKIEYTNKFKKDVKVAQKQGKDLDKLFNIITLLQYGNKLPEKNKDHKLIGQYDDARECHIEPDWLLIYRIDNKLVLLKLIRTGSHSRLLKK